VQVLNKNMINVVSDINLSQKINGYNYTFRFIGIVCDYKKQNQAKDFCRRELNNMLKEIK
jgi:hypothetical protein